jgi:hypothetical protein
MSKSKMKIKIPKGYRDRLEAVARKHGFANAETFGEHLVERGLRQHGPSDGEAPPERRLALLVDEQGYASEQELIEHLLERGLRAYEEPESDPAKLEARLRGLGYID